MLERVLLEDSSGYRATFLPQEGMTLASFEKNGIEVIDPETRILFEKRRGGLGPLIGPHFHERPLARIPSLPALEKHPLFELARKTGRRDPFSHGMARYVPWEYEADKMSIRGTLKGDSEFEGIPLKEIEGQNFTLRFEASLSEQGLQLNYSVVSDTDSLVGFHYYFRLPDKRGVVSAQVETGDLKFVLDKEVDETFHPFPDPTRGVIELDTSEYVLKVDYRSVNQENGWQLWHPNESTFVCIEPISARNPRKPILTASSLEVLLAISDRKDRTR